MSSTSGLRWAAVLVVVALLGLLAGCGGSHKKPAAAAPFAAYTGPRISGAANPLGAKWDWARLPAYLPYLRQLSGGATFYELVWCNVVPTRDAAPDWRNADTVVDSARRLGFTPLLKIRTGSCWVNADAGGHQRGAKTASAPPHDQAAYRAFVAAAVHRYAPRGVTEWAVENEPNTAASWNGSVAQYADLVRTAAASIRAADPHAVVLDGGISSTGWGTAVVADLRARSGAAAAASAYAAYYAERTGREDDFPAVSSAGALDSALDTGQARRNAAFVAATWQLLDSGVVDRLQVHFYERSSAAAGLVAYLDRLRHGKPFELWETGQYRASGAGSPAARSDEMVRTVATLLMSSARVIWLPLAVNGQGRHAQEPRYGLLGPDAGPRDAGEAFVRIAGLTRLGPLRAVHVGRLVGIAAGAGPTEALLWSPSGETSFASGATRAIGMSSGAPAPLDRVGTAPVLMSWQDAAVARRVLAATS